MNEMDIPAMAANGVHETAVDMLRLPKSGRIADIPSGAGALTQRLLRLGYDKIVCADIQIENIAVKDRVTCIRADLHQPLPFSNDEFDAVFCIECIEHIENPYHLMRELSRITKPSGQVILSTPNVMSTSARSKYLTAGYLPHFVELSFDWAALKALSYQGHIMYVPISLLLYMAFLNGLVIEEIRTNRFIRRPRLKDKMLAWLIRRTSRRFYKPDVLQLLTCDAVMYGEIIIIRLVKK